MLKISSSVEQIILKDRIALEAIERGIFNASAYAKAIHAQVEEATMKEVKLGTVIVAINRLMNTFTKNRTFTPKVKLTHFSVTTHISELTYEKTEGVVAKLASLDVSLLSKKDFFTLTQGVHEITILSSEQTVPHIKRHIGIKPAIQMDNLVAISMRFSPDYIAVPNTIFSLVSVLATRHINLMEIVSTYTELSFIVRKEEMEETINAVNEYTEN